MNTITIDVKDGEVTCPQKYADNLAKALDDLGIEWTTLEVKTEDMRVTIYRPKGEIS